MIVGHHNSKLQSVIQFSFLDMFIVPNGVLGPKWKGGVPGRTHWSCQEVCIVDIFLVLFILTL